MAENYETEFTFERAYFSDTMREISTQLLKEKTNVEVKQNELFYAKKDMWENSAHFSDDFDMLTEFNQSLEDLNGREASCLAGNKRVQDLRRMLKSPYFARIDIKENGSMDNESFYIGRGNLMDDAACKIYVYDWRSPVASVFYRFEAGEVFYQAPIGEVRGVLTLKRQYEIINGKFEYFFDASIQIEDGLLRKMLSQNASVQMRSIVETIQREQDLIIRDSENDLLMVQGAAGSGKTSVALHRAAYLMYRGMTDRLKADNMVIISPNASFGAYIEGVLPELGEENIRTVTFEEICEKTLGENVKIQTRNQLYEIYMEDNLLGSLAKKAMEYKSSAEFVTILRRYIRYFERKLIPFADVYYDGEYIATKEEAKNIFFGRGKKLPTAIRLGQLENVLLDRLKVKRHERIKKLERFVGSYPEHVFEYKQVARLYSIKESTVQLENVKRFTRLDCMKIYKKLFEDKSLFYRMLKGLLLPSNIEAIRLYTLEHLDDNVIWYDDMLAITLLKISMEGIGARSNVRHVPVDEAQDYFPMHFEILKALFPNARFTILGDINQTIGKQENLTFYDEVQRILKKKNSALLTLSKSFRCTNEITAASLEFLDEKATVENFGRSGEKPDYISAHDIKALDLRLAEKVKIYQDDGYETIVILCKSDAESEKLFERMNSTLPALHRLREGQAIEKGIYVMPIYMSKGLEFDAVMLYGTDKMRYCTDDDKKLLYVASTRALHRLSFFYVGQRSFSNA